MLTRQIFLKRDIHVKAANIKEDREIPQALSQLDIPHPRSVIVLVGGAGGIGWLDKLSVSKAIRVIARLAEETGSVVVDGGTQAGIMKEIGSQRRRNKFSFPLVGVVFDSLIMQEDPGSILDPNHTHFFLIPGENWGDESAWIAKIATAIAGDQSSLTILVNGGEISKTDVEYSLLENRPVVAMRGTGRMADKIEAAGQIVPVKITQKPDALLSVLRAKLR